MKRLKIAKEKFLKCYWHLLDKTKVFDIDFLYGGRDSGKSRFVAMILILTCISTKGFRCLLIRKNLNTVRGSQYDLIKSVIEEWGLTGLFSFNETRLEIIFKRTGGGFYGRGLDDAGKIKSFNNPSHCWIEEGNQITNDDFVIVLTSLRSSIRVKTWFTFNPECDGTYTEFWLWQEWFSHSIQLSWEWSKTIETPDGPVEFMARATHSTYRDNPYCSPQRKALYESYKGSKNNAYWYQTYTLGLWGFRRTGMEFYKCFEEGKHTADIKYAGGPLHIVADNNVNPYIAVQGWIVDTSNKRVTQVEEWPCEHPNNTAHKAALQVIKWAERRDFKDMIYVWGDPSANAKSTQDDEGRSFFDKFIGTLQQAGLKVANKVAKSAPEVALSGAFVNEIYEENYMGWSIMIGSHCRKSIEDYTMAKEDIDGKILKKKETDKETKISFEKYGHFSDDKRYFITGLLPDLFEKFKSRSKRRGSISVPA